METLLASSSSKRARVDSRADKENVTMRSASKKARLEATTPAANPYKTLPPPTTKFIQLRFQLARFKGVYRVAKVPLNYTFANLYKLILFMFGWSGDHAHQAKVFSYVEMYSGNYKAGHIKRGGKDAPLPDTDDEIMLQYNESTRRTDIAEYEVVMMGRSTKSRARRDFFGDDFGDAEEKVEDQNLRLSQVWNQKLKKNGSKGACTNKEMGIVFEYDMGAAWTVHITMDHEEDFASVEPASNLPVMITGKIKGAPPVEDARNEIFGELEAHQKSISAVFFQGNAFERYLKGEITSRASKTALKVREVPQGAVSTLANARDVVATGSSDSDSYSESDSYEEREADGAQSRRPTQNQVGRQRAFVPSISRERSLAPEEVVAHDDLEDAEGEEYDSDDEIDEETAIVVGTLVLQQMYMAGLMILLVAKRRRLI